jgi:hypothetical protein
LGVQYARQFKIPSLDIQAGTFSASKRYRKPIADLATTIDSTHFEITSTYFKYPAERIRVVGSPRIDLRLAPYRAREITKAQDDVRALLGLAPSPRPIGLLATQPIEREKLAQITKIVASATKGVAHLVIKPHPVEPEVNSQLYNDWCRQHGLTDDEFTVSSEGVYDLLAGATFVATYYSTVALEAFGLRKVVFIVDPFPNPPSLDFAAIGIGQRVRDADHLGKLIKQTLDKKEGLAPLSQDPKLSVLQDGRSAARLLSIIRELAADAPAAKISEALQQP